MTAFVGVIYTYFALLEPPDTTGSGEEIDVDARVVKAQVGDDREIGPPDGSLGSLEPDERRAQVMPHKLKIRAARQGATVTPIEVTPNIGVPNKYAPFDVHLCVFGEGCYKSFKVPTIACYMVTRHEIADFLPGQSLFLSHIRSLNEMSFGTKRIPGQHLTVIHRTP